MLQNRAWIGAYHLVQTLYGSLKECMKADFYTSKQSVMLLQHWLVAYMYIAR